MTGWPLEKRVKMFACVGARQIEKPFASSYPNFLLGSKVSAFALQIVVIYNIKHPQTWDDKQPAGPD